VNSELLIVNGKAKTLGQCGIRVNINNYQLTIINWQFTIDNYTEIMNYELWASFTQAKK